VGLIHLDAGVLIGFLNGDDARHPAARQLLAEALDAGDRLAMASSAFAECLVEPARRGPADIQTVRNLVDRVPIEVIPLDVEIAISRRASARSIGHFDYPTPSSSQPPRSMPPISSSPPTGNGPPPEPLR
jgi:predicted nucleic acid-binding protein